MKKGILELNRRTFMQGLGSLVAAIALHPDTLPVLAAPAITRPVPATGARLPVIGMGSSRTFDVENDPVARERCVQVLRNFFDYGGAIIDSSPMYGGSEQVIGYCLQQVDNRQSLFTATKVWMLGRQFGINQMEHSERLWGVGRLDLMQIHNMLDWDTHLETLRKWKEEGRIRYIGITTSHGRRHEKLEQILSSGPFDFVQFSYNILDREVEQRLLPLAAEQGIAVIVNRPFRCGELFNYSEGKPLPEWAPEFDCGNWAQFFLKFIVSHPDVTCVIPATSRVDHMQENMGAGFGRLPDAQARQRMIRYFENLI